MEDPAATIAWLLEGDVSIQYQVYRDLLGVERADLRKRIEQEASRWNTLRALRVITHFGDLIRTTEGHELFKFHDSTS